MTEFRIRLNDMEAARRAVAAIKRAMAHPGRWWFVLQEVARTVDQNAKMWAMINDIRLAKPEGKDWDPDVWKAAFMMALGREVKWFNGLDGGDPFPYTYRSSQLSKRQFSDLIELMYAYGERHGVRWSEPHPDLEQRDDQAKD